VSDLHIDQIDELIAVGEVVHNQNVCATALIQASHQVAANKTGTSGYYYHVSSPAVTIDVPNLPTTMPPARLAQRTESNQLKPAARVTASVASTVSPAPETSNTSWAWASMCSRPACENSVMPCSDLVTSKASSPNCSRSPCARRARSSSSCQIPTASRISARLGVMSVAP